MSDVDDLNDAILENATKAKRSAKGDASLERHSIPDQITLAQHVSNVAAGASRSSGLRFFRQKPRGAWE